MKVGRKEIGLHTEREKSKEEEKRIFRRERVSRGRRMPREEERRSRREKELHTRGLEQV